MKKMFTLLTIMFSIIGLIDASYISYEKIMGITPQCLPGFACATVLESPYASLGPIPLSFLGVGYYLVVFGVMSLYLLESSLIPDWVKRFDLPIANKLTHEQLILSLTTFGFFFSLYLVFLMGVIIKGWCLYCLVSAFACLMIFLSSATLYLVSRPHDQIN